MKKVIYYINKEYKIIADENNEDILHLLYKGAYTRTSSGKEEELIINTYYPKTYDEIIDDVMFFDNIMPLNKPRLPQLRTYKDEEKNKMALESYQKSLESYPKRMEKYEKKKAELAEYKREFFLEMKDAGYNCRTKKRCKVYADLV